MPAVVLGWVPLAFRDPVEQVAKVRQHDPPRVTCQQMALTPGPSLVLFPAAPRLNTVEHLCGNLHERKRARQTLR